jgi:prepilin-type processing-associated H-X9-DG protein
VELLVVIGIIAVLIGLLLPALGRARAQANAVACASNMRQVGVYLQMYANNNKGVIYPIGPEVPDPANPGKTMFSTLGAGANGPPAWYRWPVYVFPLAKVPVPTLIKGAGGWTVANASQYTSPDALPPPPAAPDDTHNDYTDTPPGQLTPVWTPKILVCPSEQDPDKVAFAHTYILNKHLEENREQLLKYSGRAPDGRSSADVVVMGEKKSSEADYYMEYGEFDAKVEPYRHGIRLGSNYLYLDGHVVNSPPKATKDALDPWTIYKDPATPPGP